MSHRSRLMSRMLFLKFNVRKVFFACPIVSLLEIYQIFLRKIEKLQNCGLSVADRFDQVCQIKSMCLTSYYFI